MFISIFFESYRKVRNDISLEKQKNFPQFRKSWCRKSHLALNKLRLFFRGKYFSLSFFSQFDIIFHVVVILDTKDIVSKNQTVFFPQNSKHSSVKDFWGRQKKVKLQLTMVLGHHHLYLSLPCHWVWNVVVLIFLGEYFLQSSLFSQ